MKSKSLILMFVSLGFGLVAAIGISQVMGRSGGNGSAIRTSPVLVAQEFIEINADLTEEMVKVEEWPANIIPENAARSLDQISNKVPIRGIPKGAPVFLTDIIDKSKSGQIAIKRGQRLISIKVGADDIMNGLMKPGDRVDIIGVFTRKEGLNTSTFSSTFQKNIQVYSVNETTSSEGPREAVGAKTNSIVGVLVNEKQAEQIALVQKVATLKLVLRGQSNGEEDEVAEEGEPLPSFLFGGEDVNNLTSKGREETGQPVSNLLNKMFTETKKEEPFVMTIWDGSQRTKYRFNKDGSMIDPEEASSTNVNPGLADPPVTEGIQEQTERDGGFEPEADSPPLGSGF